MSTSPPPTKRRFLFRYTDFQPLYLVFCFIYVAFEFASARFYSAPTTAEQGLGLALLASALVAAAWLRPFGEIAYLLLALGIELALGEDALPLMLIGAYVISVVWIRRSWIVAGVIAFLLLETTTWLSTTPELSFDLVSTVFTMTFVLVIILGIGLVLRYQRLAVEKAEQDRASAEEASNRIRSELATQLHDTTAKDLARVAITAQRIAARSTDPVLRAELDELSSLATTAAQRIRPVILNLDSAKSDTSLARAIEMSTTMLRTRSITLDTDFPDNIDELLTRQQRLIGSLIVREVATNILKYAPTNSLATLIVEFNGYSHELDLILSNEISPVPIADGITGGFGLANLEQRVAEEGGELGYAQTGNTWITHASIPAQLGKHD
ncbi:MAG: histidine kinase [Actinomycetaceae bacterium]|nr:histidine kinase [Actinomycetaceae bacterium]